MEWKWREKGGLPQEVVHNKIVRTRLKSLVKGIVAGASPESAAQVASAADKAAKSGVIHPNKANRIKARLAKKLAAAKK